MKTEGRPEGVEVYYTRSRIDRLVLVIITSMILILMILPVYALYSLVDELGTRRANATYMGVLLVATLAFSAVLALFTRARRHEILGAAAGYCAVLVIFLGNVGNR
jgi:drug/metabolite transporter superfamily protein YnfA